MRRPPPLLPFARGPVPRIPMKQSTKTRVLLIDDREDDRNQIKGDLLLNGYDVLELSSGVGAEQLIASEGVGVVITDIAMPDREGVETVRALRNRFPKLPIFVVTRTHFGNVALLLGAIRSFQKPVAK